LIGISATLKEKWGSSVKKAYKKDKNYKRKLKRRCFVDINQVKNLD